ncbi:hypothetical protein ACFOYW_14320 [Gryllotalpicola reticulitermitis]|uniref:DUF4307 domain-containing protein n=1 Tax=Gryllotalpicola reticulitermitis TaxID=1184153 RepID=A0ABV8Q9P7_9MICO
MRDAPRSRRRFAPLIVMLSVFGAVLLGVGGIYAWASIEPWTEGLSCSYPAKITGAITGQSGPVRCYLKALADDSTPQMLTVTRSNFGEPDVTEQPDPSAFRFSKDARSGVAHVKIEQTGVGADALVVIRFADGKLDVQRISLVDPSSAVAWRMGSVDDHTTKSYTSADGY